MDRTPFEHEGQMYVRIDGDLYVLGSWGWERSHRFL